MDLTIKPRLLRGQVAAPPSKSHAHRLLICAALARRPVFIRCPETNNDIDATYRCLRALGAQLQRTQDGYMAQPTESWQEHATLNCGESASTLRFLLPIAGALGVDTTFRMEGRLPQRPLSPLWEEMERMGCSLNRPTPNTLRCHGRLRPGAYALPGNVSSQFITGLMFAHRILGGCSLQITGTQESQPYIRMTRQALELFSDPPAQLQVEGDWSAGAFWLAAAAMGSDITVTGLNECSAHGDRAIRSLLPLLERSAPTIDCRDHPDLVPVLAVVAACSHGASFTGISRLRLKESDRVAAICSLLTALGGRAEASEECLTVYPCALRGGKADSFGDHRIAMAAAIAATRCSGEVLLLGAEAVSKSYPRFWEDYKRLGGLYE